MKIEIRFNDFKSCSVEQLFLYKKGLMFEDGCIRSRQKFAPALQHKDRTSTHHFAPHNSRLQLRFPFLQEKKTDREHKNTGWYNQAL